MTLCIIDGEQCECQPQERAYCIVACNRIAALEADIANADEARKLAISLCREAQEIASKAQAWKQAVDDLLSTWYTTADSYATPREALKALIAFEVMTALDPKVSSDAAALVEQARKEELEACAQLARADEKRRQREQNEVREALQP